MTIQNIIKSALLVFTLILAYSCIDEVQLTQEDNLIDSFFVDGIVALNEDGSYVEVFANRIFNLSVESRRPLELNGINVLNKDGISIPLRKSGFNVFRYDFDGQSAFQIDVGQEYKIELQLTSGETWESEWESIPEAQITPKINQQIVEREVFIDRRNPFSATTFEEMELTVDTELPENHGILWDVQNIYKITDSPWPVGTGPDYEDKRNTCYIRNRVDVNAIPLFDPRTTEKSNIANFPISSESSNWRFNEGLYYEVRQRTVSYEALDYWNIIRSLLTLGQNVFDERPGGLTISNISSVDGTTENVFGYFYATREKLVRFKASAELIGERDPYCPWTGEMADCGMAPGCCWAACCNCLEENNSTTDRPTWWVD